MTSCPLILNPSMQFIQISGATYRVRQDVQNFIQQVAVITKIFPEMVILDVLFQNLPIGPYRIHRISHRKRSIFRSLCCRIDRWISITPISLIFISIDCVRFSEVLTFSFRMKFLT